MIVLYYLIYPALVRKTPQPAPDEVPSPWTGYDPPPPAVAMNRRFTGRQTKLLDELQDVVFAEGFAHLRVADIRERIDCAWATLYKIARSRDELILLVVDRWHRRLIRESIEQSAHHRDAVGLLGIWLDLYGTAIAGVSPRFVRDANESVAVGQLVERYNRYFIHTVSRTIEIGIEQGSIRKVDPIVAAHVWLASAERLLHRGLSNDPARRTNAITELRRILFEGLVQNPNAQPLPAGGRKRR